MAEYSEKFKAIRKTKEGLNPKYKNGEGRFNFPELSVLTRGQSGFLLDLNPDSERELEEDIFPNMTDLVFQSLKANIDKKYIYRSDGSLRRTLYFVQLLPDIDTSEQMESDVNYIYNKLVGEQPKDVVDDLTMAKFFDPAAAHSLVNKLNDDRPAILLGQPEIQSYR